MAPSKQTPFYRVYLLTAWQEPTGDESTQWRFRLEDPRSGRRQGFADAATLVAALQSGLSDEKKPG
jgi:hypothetical protein